MTSTTKKIIRFLLIPGLIMVFSGQSVAADSLYEEYTNATQANLESETRKMGRELGNIFSQDSIASRQRQIDFAEYYANLKKLVLYATKLSTYSEYEKDLRFAADKEIFKGLPEEVKAPEKNTAPVNRKEFVRGKYDLMKRNVEDEIDTYVDLIQLSLDACEALSENDLSDFLGDQKNHSRVEQFIKSEEFRDFQVKRGRFVLRWKMLDDRISKQLALWEPRPPNMDDPIIDPKITGAI